MTVHQGTHPRRRDILALAALACVGSSAAGHGALGPVEPPRVAPPLPLLLHDGRRTLLPTLLQGRVTALQLMFTGCSAICPAQGAVFASVQAMTAARPAAGLLLSLSIDPLSDDAHALTEWRRKFGAGDGWVAAAPPLKHAEVMLDFVDGRVRRDQAGDRHNAQVFLFDRHVRLAYRLAEFASARDVASAMQELARRS